MWSREGRCPHIQWLLCNCELTAIKEGDAQECNQSLPMGSFLYGLISQTYGVLLMAILVSSA